MNFMFECFKQEQYPTSERAQRTSEILACHSNIKFSMFSVIFFWLRYRKSSHCGPFEAEHAKGKFIKYDKGGLRYLGGALKIFGHPKGGL